MGCVRDLTSVQRQGNETANARTKQIRAISSEARKQIRVEAEEQAGRETEEIRRLLEGMAVRQVKEEDEMRKRFADREKKLWEVSGDTVRIIRELTWVGH
jgi:nucleoporin GLE1